MSNYKMADGLRWLDRGPTTDDHLAHGGHEVELGPLLRGLYKPGTTYVNIGAHVGTWALRMATLAAHTVAVEANPTTFQTLVHHAKINAPKFSGKLVCSRAILWDREGARVNFASAQQGVSETGSLRVEAANPKYWSVGADFDTITLDALLNQHEMPPVGLVQIDVEGAEARVLRGSAETIARDKPVLLIELHEGHPGTDENLREQVLDFLVENGYSWSSVAVGVEEYLVCLPDTTPEFTDIA